MGFKIQFCLIYLFLNSCHGVAMKGDNVRDAVDREFPFAVAIIDASNDLRPSPRADRQFCTGSLITKKHVLTAEHCVLKKQRELVEILVGSVDLDLCKVYDPKAWETYQEWKYKDPKKFPLYYHDVAVITLKDCVTDANTQLAIVPKFKPEDLYGEKVKIAGWGLTNNNVKPKVLKTVDLKVITKAQCESEISELKRENTLLHDSKLCATSDPWALNDCGDSGGPLLNERKEVIGITMGTCPDDKIILRKFPRLLVQMNRLLEKRVNLHASLHFYTDFVEHFTNSKEARDCEKSREKKFLR